MRTKVSLSERVPETVPARNSELRSVVAGAAVGTFIEWFDFAVYGYLAYIIASQFFAEGDRVAAVLSVFAVFAVAFFVRPLGGVFFGHLGDKVSRRTSLAVCVTVMSVSTGLIGVLPGYQDIGVLAPVLLLVCRLGQGFSAGGEQSGAQTLLIEASPSDRRVWYGSVLQISQFLGQLTAALLATWLAFAFSSATLVEWGWRIPFLVAFPLGLIGLFIRMRLRDGEAYREVRKSGSASLSPLREALRTQKHRMLTLFGMWIAIQVGFYLAFVFMPTYLIERGAVHQGQSLLINSVGLIYLVVFLPVVARLSDRIPRRVGMLVMCVALAVAPWPALMLVAEGNLLTGILAQMLMVTPFLLVPIAGVVTAEMFPTRLRYTASAVSYGICTMIFGGTAPFVATFLVEITGLTVAPAIYLFVASAVSFIVVFFGLKETRGIDLVQAEDTQSIAFHTNPKKEGSVA